MADYFISYTSSDRDEAHWIAQELRALGHTTHVHEWEIAGGKDVPGWMEHRLETADHVLCVISQAYLKALYSTWERNAALWEAVRRPGFVLFVVVKPCTLPRLLAPFKHCELHGLPEPAMRVRLEEYMKNPAPPIGHISLPTQVVAESNITIHVPAHFMGRDEALPAIDKALSRHEGRAAILAIQGMALHGMRGVGKTVLAAAYAQLHRRRYRATWWIRAESDSTARADLAALGVRLGWVAANATEEQAAVATVLDYLQHEGEGILLIYDNARDTTSLRPILPRGGAARVLITSNNYAWRKIVEPVEIHIWPEKIGADFLVARTGRPDDRDGALGLSKALAGLPLAHEQAAAFCEHLGVSFDDYRKRFEAAPITMLDDSEHAADEYQLTVARTFSLGIEEAAKFHPAAEPLIVYAALLAPEPIPHYLFSEGRQTLGEPLASALADNGLLKAISALRAFALIELETVTDEQDPTVTTETIRLHRLVREVAAFRCPPAERSLQMRALIATLIAIYPIGVFNHPATWPRARRLDALATALVGPDGSPIDGIESAFSNLLDRLAAYRQSALAAYAVARPLYERALAIREKALGPDHPDTAASLNSLAGLHRRQGDFAAARPLYKRALAICEKVLGPDHPHTATSLNNLAYLYQSQGKFTVARPLFERALAIRERTLGPDHLDTANSLNNLGGLHESQGDYAAARPFYERALAICEKALGPDHPDTAGSINNLAYVRRRQGDFAAARPLYERALEIREKALGPDHPDTAISLNNLAYLHQSQSKFAAAHPLFERAFKIHEKVLGADHPDTAISINNLAGLHESQGDFAAARPLYERALTIFHKVFGPNHPNTKTVSANLARMRRQ